MTWVEQKILGLFVKTKGHLSRPLLSGLGHVFMLHRVLPEPFRSQRSIINRDLAISPEHLEFCIQYFINNNYEFITLDELHHTLIHRIKRRQRFICITLDDGYSDNIEYGLPIFKKYNIPFCIYVTNCFVNRTGNMWWYYLEDYMNRHQRLAVDENTQFEWESEVEKMECFSMIRAAILKMGKSRYNDFFENTISISAERVKTDCDSEALSWHQLSTLSKEPLATIGAHTMNHLPLSALTDSELTEEVFQSKKELEMKLGKPVHHFAYPYGSFNEVGKRELAIAKAADFKTAVLNVPGNIFYANAKSLYVLPRMPLGNVTDVQKLHEILTGINHYSYNRFHKIPVPAN
jgi:peptidoglycan/xylan/chitin deacetylase (PgdA/CDA1 family)